MQVMLEIA